MELEADTMYDGPEGPVEGPIEMPVTVTTAATCWDGCHTWAYDPSKPSVAGMVEVCRCGGCHRGGQSSESDTSEGSP